MVLVLGFVRVWKAPGTPFDEHTHFDYVVKIAQNLRLPPMSDLLGQTALQAWACTDAPAFAGLECGAAVQNPSNAPWQGLSTATGYMPWYYVMTGLATRAVHDLPEDASWLEAARAVSVGWLGLLALLVTSIVRRLGGNNILAFSTALILCTMPLVLMQGAAVNPDVPATALALSAVWIWLATSNWTPSLRLVSAGSVGLIAVMAKESAVAGLLVVAFLEAGARGRAYLADSRERERQREPRPATTSVWRSALPSVAMLVFLGVTYMVLRLKVMPSLRESGVDLPGAIPAEESVDLSGWVKEATLYALESLAVSPEGVLGGEWFRLPPTILAFCAIGGVVFAILRSPTPWRATLLESVAQGTGLYLLLFPALMLLFLDWQGNYLFFQPRYVLPGMALAVIAFFAGARWGWSLVLGAASLALWLATLRELLAM